MQRGSASAQALRRDGFSLVDVVVGVALFLIIFLALTGTFRATIAVSAAARAKGASLGIAQSRMEYLRGLPYNALGTISGTPSGALADNATTTLDDIDYGVHTTIIYADSAHDYKRAEVVVTAYGTKVHTLSLVSDFAP
jgi:hypothetical protein